MTFFLTCFVDSNWFHYFLWTPADPVGGPDYVRVLLHFLLLLHGWNRLWVSGSSAVFTGEEHERWCVLQESHWLSVGLDLLVSCSQYCCTAKTTAMSLSANLHELLCRVCLVKEAHMLLLPKMMKDTYILWKVSTRDTLWAHPPHMVLGAPGCCLASVAPSVSLLGMQPSYCCLSSRPLQARLRPHSNPWHEHCCPNHSWCTYMHFRKTTM